MSTAPIINAQLSGDSNQLKTGATLTLKAGSTVTLENGATFTVPDDTWGMAKVNGLVAALRNLTAGEAEVSIASAATTNIGGAAASRVAITGTTTITSLGTTTNVIRFVRFAGALTLTHNATTLILPGGANIATAAGDCATFISNGSGNWRCVDYQQYIAPGTAPTAATTTNTTQIASTAFAQAVNNASGARTTVAVTAATNYNLAAASAQNRRLLAEVTITAFTGTATLTVQTTNAQAGDEREIVVTVPTGNSGILELRNATSGGTLLGTVPVDATKAATWSFWTRYNGTAWGTATLSYQDTKAALDSRFNQWVSDTGYVLSVDNPVSASYQVQSPGARGNMAGIPLAEWCGWLSVPSASAIGNPYLALLNSIIGDVQANSMQIRLLSDTLRIDARGASIGSDYRTFDHTTFRTLYSGQRVWLEVLITAGTSNPVVRVNGVNISASFSLSSGGTVPNWFSTSLVSTHHLTGLFWPAGEAPFGCWINGHLTQTESDDWRTKGKIPAWVAAGGTLKNIYTGDNADFTAGLGNWAGYGATSPSSASGKMRVSIAAGVSGAAIYQAVPYGIAGRIYDVSFTVSNYALTTGTCGFNIEQSAGAGIGITGNGTFTGTVAFPTNGAGGIPIFIGSGGGSGQTFDVDNFSMVPRGALSLPVVYQIPVLGDGTGLGDNCARLVGMLGITTRKDWLISGNTATNGNEQLLGGDVIVNGRDVIEFVEQIPSDTATTIIGSVSGGAQYKASSTIYQAIQPTTLVTREVTSNAIWIGSNTTANVRTNIKGRRAY